MYLAISSLHTATKYKNFYNLTNTEDQGYWENACSTCIMAQYE